MTSIIILTYNSEKYIKKLIESIYEFNKDQDFEIIVVDNKSSDETVPEAKRLNIKDLRLRIIETGANLGFSKGINLGAKSAKGEYLLFINPDTEWKSGSISNLISVFDQKEKVGIVGGKLIDKRGNSEKSAGKFFGISESALIALGMDEQLRVRFSPNKTSRVDFVSGGFMMVRRKLFEELGGFDENLFMYVEDMELSFRVRKAGYATYFTPDVMLVHDAHGSSNRSFAIKNIYHGMFYFQKKHGNTFSYFTVKSLFGLKAITLVLAGKIMNNKNLSETYLQALKQ